MFNPDRNRRTLILALIYGALLAVVFYLSYEVRFDFMVPEQYQAERLRLLILAVGVKLVALVLVGQFGSMLTFFSIPDLLRVIWAMTSASVALLLPRLFGLPLFAPPRGTLLLDYIMCIGALCILRLGTRVYRERMMSGRRPSTAAQRIAIVGAGQSGAALAREFASHPARGFKPVMFFDDDSRKHGKLVHGVPVLGAPELIKDSATLPEISKVVIAMPSASGRRVREIVALMTQRGFKVETLPSMEELASGRVKASRIRPVEVQDLLGRDPVNLDSVAIRKLVEGRVVMVTGAGGSIGSELCRQIVQLNPQRLLMVEQSEAHLFNVEQELTEAGNASAALPVVANIMDRQRMDFVFSRYRPTIVFHAAAHKHVHMMERQPAVAFYNNVLGTRLIAEMAGAYGVAEFVFISTDKAINPTSVMGATKRLAEIQLQMIQRSFPATKFMAVRFGNVLGSSGSVIPIFKRQIARGGPVTVTHPEVTRYFMTIPEAVGLVLQSTVMGRAGDIFVLNMGQAIKIADLARQMIELSGFQVGDDIEITFTGLKPGEKLYEELQHSTELHTPTEHPQIMRFTSPNADGGAATLVAIQQVELELHVLTSNGVKSAMQRLAPEYTPHLD